MSNSIALRTRSDRFNAILYKSIVSARKLTKTVVKVTRETASNVNATVKAAKNAQI